MRLLQMDGDPCITSIVVTLIEIKFVSFELKLTISFDGNRSKGIDNNNVKMTHSVNAQRLEGHF